MYDDGYHFRLNPQSSPPQRARCDPHASFDLHIVRSVRPSKKQVYRSVALFSRCHDHGRNGNRISTFEAGEEISASLEHAKGSDATEHPSSDLVRMPGFPPPIDPSYEPTVSIERIAATAPIEDMIAILERDGALILTNLVSTQDVAAVNDEMNPYVEKARAETHAAYDLIPKQTIMVPGVVGKSPTMAKIAEIEVIDALRTAVLEKRCTATWEDRTEEFTIGPLLNSSLTYHISHGAPRQRLHRDDMIYGVYHAGEYSLSKESMLGFMIAGCKTTRQNGATMAIPGSHKWDHSRVPRPDEVCFAEMEPGSAFVFLGTVYHGAGHNSVVDQVRKVYGLFFVPGTMRTEENQFLAIPRSKVTGMSEKMLSLLGYKVPGTYLGIVNNGDPSENLEEVFTLSNS